MTYSFFPTFNTSRDLNRSCIGYSFGDEDFVGADIALIEFYDWDEGMKKYAFGMLCLGLSMTSISSIAFFLSCFPIKPAAATITALSYVLVDFILRTSGFMESYQHLLITKHMGAWARTLAETPDWPLIIRGYAIIFAVNISLFTLGYGVFESRDLKS